MPSYIVAEMQESKDKWRLVYSTLGLSSTSGANFFALYNSTLSKFRFFYFIPEEGINDATSAFFILEQYNKNGKMSMALNSNEPIEMSNETQNSGAVTLKNNYDPSGTTQAIQIVPLGTGENRVITSGWACFDLLADHGYTDATKEALEDPNTIFTLRLVTTLKANIDLVADLNTSGDIDMAGVTLVKKGSGLAAAATCLNGLGTSLYQIGSGMTNVVDKTKIAGGVVQIIGGVSTFAGTILNTVNAAKDSKQYLEGLAQVDLHTGGKITGVMTYNTINNVPAIQFRPVSFKYKWETLTSNNPQTRAAGSTLPSYGLLTLTKNPVVYVSVDHLLYSPAQYPAEYEMDYDSQLIHCVTNDDEQLRYISFLDPSTVGVYINKEMMGFDEVKVSVSLVANAGPYDEYLAPNPYINYYQLKNEQIQISTQEDVFVGMFSERDTKSMKLVECKNTDIPTIVKDPDLDAKYTVTELPCNDGSTDTQETGFNYRFYGLTGEMFGGAKKIVVDPIVYVPTNKDHTFIYNKSHLGPVMIEVCAQLYKGDLMQMITKHFLPEIRTYKSSEISTIRDRINQNIPTTVETNTNKMQADFVDINWQKNRALKMLELSGK